MVGWRYSYASSNCRPEGKLPCGISNCAMAGRGSRMTPTEMGLKVSIPL